MQELIQALLHDCVIGGISALVLLLLARIGWFPMLCVLTTSKEEYEKMKGRDD